LRLLKVRFETVSITKPLAYQCLSWIVRPEMGYEAAKAIFSHHNPKVAESSPLP
jgi:hypothetical protein